MKVPVSLQPIFMITHAVTKDSPMYGKTEREINEVKSPSKHCSLSTCLGLGCVKYGKMAVTILSCAKLAAKI